MLGHVTCPGGVEVRKLVLCCYGKKFVLESVEGEWHCKLNIERLAQDMFEYATAELDGEWWENS